MDLWRALVKARVRFEHSIPTGRCALTIILLYSTLTLALTLALTKSGYRSPKMIMFVCAI